MVYQLSTTHLGLLNRLALPHYQRMVDKQPSVTVAYLRGLKAASGLDNAGISRAIVKNDGKATPQAVGKWLKTGKISSDNLRRLQTLAAMGKPSVVEHAEEDTNELRLIILSELVRSITANLPGVAEDFAILLRDAVKGRFPTNSGMVGAALEIVARGRRNAAEAVQFASQSLSADVPTPNRRGRSHQT